MTEPEPETAEIEHRPHLGLNAENLAWLLVGGGVLSALVNIVRDRRGLADWALPVGLVGAGAAILLARRRTHLEVAQRNILAELDSLGPVARAQVLASVAKQQLQPGR